MHALLFERVAEKPRGRSRTLVVKDGTVWMWPGVPLTVRLDGQTYLLPDDCIRFWTTCLHGFEADPISVKQALVRAAEQLTLGDQDDRSGLDRLSPEGDMLMAVAARRLGVLPVRMSVGYRSVPWGSGEIHKEADLFDSFAHPAIALEKAWNEDDHPRWPKKAPDSQGGRFTAANSGAGRWRTNRLHARHRP